MGISRISYLHFFVTTFQALHQAQTMLELCK
jgi:hypothetical protein